MKKSLVVFLLMVFAVSSFAQGNRDITPSYQYHNVRVVAKVLDAKSSAPVPYATVYLIPQGDTTITNFALSDEKGFVVLEKVAAGRYELNAELLGYKTFTKAYDIYQAPGWDLDLGTIGMEEDTELIDAATITAAGNPITIQNDTVIYNASSFRVGENAMLEDLLKKMPGIQVSEDGTATVNGEKVDRITVGGKTFFFGDPSTSYFYGGIGRAPLGVRDFAGKSVPDDRVRNGALYLVAGKTEIGKRLVGFLILDNISLREMFTLILSGIGRVISRFKLEIIQVGLTTVEIFEGIFPGIKFLI